MERDPSAHTDIDQSLIAKLPLESSAGLNQVITLASPGVVSDSNGFFHPVGDHAQTQFSIDNQPVTDQQSRLYSNQISPDAVESMEIITGVAPAEYGDKSSLIVHIVTKSGLDQREADRQRVVRLRFVQESDRRRQPRRRVACGRQLPVGDRHANGSIPRSARVPGPARHREPAVVLRSRRCSCRRAGDLPSQRPGRPVGVRRTEQPGRRRGRSGPASADRHVQRGARAVTSDRIARVVHGQRVRPPGSPDLLPEPGSVRRPAWHRQPEPQADEPRDQGGPGLFDGEPQRQGGRARSARRSSTNSSPSDSPIRRSIRRAWTPTAIPLATPRSWTPVNAPAY